MSRRPGSGPDRHERSGRPGGGRPGDSGGGPAAAALRVDVPASVTADQLDPEARGELRTLPGDLADAVARLLVATGLADDPHRSYEYARKARDLAARVGIVRETCAIAAYQAEDWTTALAEFRAARRLTGRSSYLPLMADCERALGRPDRALDIVTGADAQAADHQTRLELRIVESGIRRDQGLPAAAVVALQGPELTGDRVRPEYARLYYAYADALLDSGRAEEARIWFGRAAAADTEGLTDAADRYEELDDVSFDEIDGYDVDADSFADDELDDLDDHELGNLGGDDEVDNSGPEDLTAIDHEPGDRAGAALGESHPGSGADDAGDDVNDDDQDLDPE